MRQGKNLYKGKDGLTRDILKLWSEFRYYWAPAMLAALREFFAVIPRPFQMIHKFTNLWVEACRASPYFFGHVLVICFWVSVCIKIGEYNGM